MRGRLEHFTRIFYVIIGDQNVPLTGSSHNAGAGGTGATVAAGIAVDVFSAFVTGHGAEHPGATQMIAFTENDLPVVVSMAVAAAPLVVPATTPSPTPTGAVLTPVSAKSVAPATAAPTAKS